jgi:hypothetical protein
MKRSEDFYFGTGEKSSLPPLEKPKPKEPEFAFRGTGLDEFRINPQELADQGLETDDEGAERIKNIPQSLTAEERLAKKENREEMVEAIKALQEKVSVLKLEQADCDIQIKTLKDQIEGTTEETLPSLTGERVKQLKDYQGRMSQVSEDLRRYQDKLTRTETQYRLAFPDSPLEG